SSPQRRPLRPRHLLHALRNGSSRYSIRLDPQFRVLLEAASRPYVAAGATTDRKINPGPPAQRLMKPPLSRYIALAQRRTNGAYVASRDIMRKKSLPWRNRESSIELLLCETPGLRTDTDQWL